MSPYLAFIAHIYPNIDATSAGEGPSLCAVWSNPPRVLVTPVFCQGSSTARLTGQFQHCRAGV